VAGTREGITALQMDIKVPSISIQMMREALAQAKKARLQILDTMESTLGAHRESISAYAPRLFKLSIPTDKIRDLTASAEMGKTYLGKVVRLAEFGAFVELFPGTDGLLHISEISEHRIRDVRDELKLGDQVLVKVLAIEGNKIRLSRKALIREAREKQAHKKDVPGGG